MSTRLALRVQENMARLTVSEQKLAQVILHDPAMIETHSATELARIAGVSKATAARFFRTLGYSDFEEVKLQARDERNRTQPYIYSADLPQSVVHGRTIGEHLRLELDNLGRTFEEMQPDQLRDAVRLIEAAPKLWFLAYAVESWFAGYGRQLFSALRPNALLLGESGQTIAEDLAMTGPRDVMILPLIGPQRKSLRPVLAYARTTRMTIIAISDYANLPLARRFGANTLCCHVARFGPFQAWGAPMSMLRLLAEAYAGQVGDAIYQRMALIEHIGEEMDLMG